MPQPGPGRVLVRLLAGGICGSDLPSFIGRRNTFVDFYGEPGYPLHEVVGEVVARRAAARARGSSAGPSVTSGWPSTSSRAPTRSLALDDELTDVEATVVQPLCTVLHQLDRIPDVRASGWR